MAFPKKHIANMVTGVGILTGVAACILVLTDPSWIWAEILLALALLTDALDGKAARKFGGTRAGPYLDDIADFINFWLHPGLWIWLLTGSIGFTALYICCIFYRLVRFTMHKQDTETYFSWLPSPAAALGIMGIIIITSEPSVLLLSSGLISFLAISHMPCMHVMKMPDIARKMPFFLLAALILPWLYGGDLFAVGLAQTVAVLAYVLASIIVLLIPHYVLR